MSRRNSLLKSLLNVSGMTLMSRVLGFIRDTIIAFYFGASPEVDAFLVASKLPNLLRRIFAEGAFSQAFVPVLAEFKYKSEHFKTRDFVASVVGLLTLVLVIITLLGIIFSQGVLWISAPGFTTDPHKFALASFLLQITFPYILLISIASLIGGVLNTWGVFSIPAFTPTLLNISYIVFCVFLTHHFHPPILTLALALVVGGLLQLLFQLPFLKKIDMLVMPKLDFKNKAVWRVIKLMGPTIFSVSVAQISVVINTIYASFLPSGSVSWMYYADRLMEFPTGVLGVALGTILLPSLSKYATSANTQEFSRLLDIGIRLCLVIALPTTLGIGLLAKELTMTLFMHGKFDMHAVTMTSYALIAYSIGLVGLILVKVLAPGFYANQDIKTPVKIAILSFISIQVLNLIFVGPLKHAGLSLSTGLGACINALLLAYFLIKKSLYKPQPGWLKFMQKLIFAVVIMGISIELSLNYLPLNFSASILSQVMSLSVVIVIAVLSYFIALRCLGFRVKDFTLTVSL